jgi:predicted aspartyl protease
MRLLRPVFFIFLIIGQFFNSGAKAQNTPVVTLPFVLNNDHIIIRLRLDDSAPLNFLFDSGAGGTLITKEAADSMLFRTSSRRKNIGVTGAHKVGVIKGVKLSVGDKKLANITLLSTDKPLEELDDGRKVHGIIGYPILSRYIVEVDYSMHVLNFYNRNSFTYSGNGQTLPLDFISNLPISRATIIMYNDMAFEGDFLVDTGARSYMIISSPSVVQYDMAENIGNYYNVRAKIGSSQKRTKFRHGKLQSVEFAGHKFQHLPVALSSYSKGVLSLPDIDGIIGNRLLMRFKVIFDYQHGLIHLEPNDRLEDSYEVNTSGFNINFLRGKPFIKNLIDQSPADKAGLRNGDEIISINGKLVKVMVADDIRRSFVKEGEKIEIVIQRNRKLKYTEFTLKSLI